MLSVTVGGSVLVGDIGPNIPDMPDINPPINPLKIRSCPYANRTTIDQLARLILHSVPTWSHRIWTS